MKRTDNWLSIGLGFFLVYAAIMTGRGLSGLLFSGVPRAPKVISVPFPPDSAAVVGDTLDTH